MSADMRARQEKCVEAAVAHTLDVIDALMEVQERGLDWHEAVFILDLDSSELTAAPRSEVNKALAEGYESVAGMHGLDTIPRAEGAVVNVLVVWNGGRETGCVGLNLSGRPFAMNPTAGVS